MVVKRRMNALPMVTATTPETSEILVARQPIFNRDMDVVAYELLFRGNHAQHANVVDHDQATSQVIINAFMEIGIGNLVGDKLAYINMPSAFLLGDYPIPFPPEKVVLEILEHVEVSATLITALRRLSLAGYVMALDDFVYSEKTKPLLNLARVVKLDVLDVKADVLRKQVGQLLPYKLKLLAEKIETKAVFDQCKRLGFEYFQGYFLCRPQIVEGATLPASRLQLLKLLAELNDPDIQMHTLEKTVGSDVSLSYKLLRVVNSAQHGIRQKVESLRHALILLGVKKIREWATLIVLTSIDNKPRELFVISLQRAKYCQLLAQARGAANVDVYFTAGLFSTLDALLDKPLAELVPQLSLADELNQALLDRNGQIGAVLTAVIAYEQADWNGLAGTGIAAGQMRDFYLEAVRWSREAAQQLSAK